MSSVSSSTSPISSPTSSSEKQTMMRRQGLPTLAGIEAAKRAAAYAAVDTHVLPHHTAVGIGSGSTVPYVVERILQQGPTVNASRQFVPTGFQSRQLILQAGLTLAEPDAVSHLDVDIDGADECDPSLNCIKGGGACQLREKVLAEMADTFVVVADDRKDGQVLGTNWVRGVPIEIDSFALSLVMKKIRALGAIDPQLRMAKMKAGPVISDNGNLIIDAPFPQDQMKNPAKLLAELKALTGVVEVGLFVNICKAAYLGGPDGTVTIKKVDGSVQKGVKVDVYALPDFPDAQPLQPAPTTAEA